MEYIAEVWVRSPAATDEMDPYHSFWQSGFGSRAAARRWALGRLKAERNATSADIHVVEDDGDWRRIESVGV